MLKKAFTMLLPILLLFQFQSSPALALSCVALTIEEAYDRYHGVIVARVDAVESLDRENNRINLSVMKSFKFIDQEQLMIKENATWGSGMGRSQVGEEYLFFLIHDNGTWVNPLCSPTVNIADASEQLEFLKNKEIPLNTNPPEETPQTSTEESSQETKPGEQILEATPISPDSHRQFYSEMMWGAMGVFVVIGSLVYWIRKRGTNFIESSVFKKKWDKIPLKFDFFILTPPPRHPSEPLR